MENCFFIFVQADKLSLIDFWIESFINKGDNFGLIQQLSKITL